MSYRRLLLLTTNVSSLPPTHPTFYPTSYIISIAKPKLSHSYTHHIITFYTMSYTTSPQGTAGARLSWQDQLQGKQLTSTNRSRQPLTHRSDWKYSADLLKSIVGAPSCLPLSLTSSPIGEVLTPFPCFSSPSIVLQPPSFRSADHVISIFFHIFHISVQYTQLTHVLSLTHRVSCVSALQEREWSLAENEREKCPPALVVHRLLVSEHLTADS